MFNTLVLFAKRHQSTLLRLAIIAGTLCILPAIGYVAANIDPFLILAAVLAPIGVFAIVLKIELGIMAMLVAGVFIRFRLPTGTASEIVISLVLCCAVLGLWITRMLLQDKHLSIKPSPVNAPLIGFICTVAVGLLWSEVYRDILVQRFGSPFVAIASGFVMMLLPATTLLAANLVQDMRWLRAIVWLFLAEGLVSLGVTLVIDLNIGPREQLYNILFRNGFFWANTQGLFSMWYLAISLALALFDRTLSWQWRAALFIYAGIWVFWGFYLRISWLSGWVPAFVAAAVVVFFHSRKLFLVALAVMVIGAGGYWWRTSLEAETEESGHTRLAAYAVNWRITSKHLFFGTGPAGYRDYYMSYFPTEAMASHSNYIDIIAQTGLIGVLFIVWFFSAQGIGGVKLRRKLKGRGDFAEGLTVAVLGGTAGCVIGMGLGDWLLPFAFTQGIIGFDGAMFNWFFMGILWALYHILARETERDTPTAQGNTDKFSSTRKEKVNL